MEQNEHIGHQGGQCLKLSESTNPMLLSLVRNFHGRANDKTLDLVPWNMACFTAKGLKLATGCLLPPVVAACNYTLPP